MIEYLKIRPVVKQKSSDAHATYRLLTQLAVFISQREDDKLSLRLGESHSVHANCDFSASTVYLRFSTVQ